MIWSSIDMSPFICGDTLVVNLPYTSRSSVFISTNAKLGTMSANSMAPENDAIIPLADASPATRRKCKEKPVPFSLPFFLQPTLRQKSVTLWKDIWVEPVQRVGLATNNRSPWNVVSTDVVTLTGHVSWETHGYRGEQSKTFLDYSIQVDQVIDLDVGIVNNLLVKMFLNVLTTR